MADGCSGAPGRTRPGWTANHDAAGPDVQSNVYSRIAIGMPWLVVELTAQLRPTHTGAFTQNTPGTWLRTSRN